MKKTRESEHIEIVLEKLEAFKESNDTSHASILAQVLKTNGSVAQNTKDIDSLKQWRAYVLGAVAMLSFVVVTLLGIIYLVRK